MRVFGLAVVGMQWRYSVYSVIYRPCNVNISFTKERKLEDIGNEHLTKHSLD